MKTKNEKAGKVTKIDLAQAKRDYEKKLAELLGKDFKGTNPNLSNAERRRQLRKEIRKKLKKEPKYNNTHSEVIYKGQLYKFPSKLEAGHFHELTIRQDAGEISDLRCQESVYMTEARIEYIVDFSYQEKNRPGRTYYESKGLELDVFKLKKRLWKNYGPGRLIIDFGKGRREEVVPVGIKRKCSLCGK